MSYHRVDRVCLARAELLILIGFAALGAAILVPKLLRADIASDEAQALADTRTVYLAEETYAAANLGYYSDVTNLCRSGPECRGIGIPGYPATAPEFLSADLGRFSPFTKDGYDHVWTRGRSPDYLPASADPHSVSSYCYNTFPTTFTGQWPRSFSVDGSGRIYYDDYGGAITCPIDYTAPLLEEPRPALAVDFGRRGLWRYDGNDEWIQLERSNPVLVRAWRETLLATFTGRQGLYLLDDAGWTRIANRTASDVVPLVDAVVARFRSEPGLWYWDEKQWTQVSSWEPEAIEVVGNKLLVDFGAEGLWFFWKPLGWTKFSDQNPSFVHAGRDLFADLADGQGLQWFYIDDLHEGRVSWHASNEPTPEAIFEFPRNPNYGSRNIATDRGVAGGIWLNSTQVTSWDPYLLSHLDGDLLAAFRGRGLYRFEDETSWVELSTSEPTELAPADTYVGALFDDLRGVRRFDDSGSQQITLWQAESVTAVDLATASQTWQLRRAGRCPVPVSDRRKDSCRRLVGRATSRMRRESQRAR